MKTYRIFLASSYQLQAERTALVAEINRLNDKFFKKHVHLELVIWEKLDAGNDPVRKQNFYNEQLKTCDILILAYWGQLGIFTKEEYQLAQNLFVANGLPKIYSFKKTATVDFDLKPENVANLTELEVILYKKDKEQWPWEYENAEGFIHKFTIDLEARFNDPSDTHFIFPDLPKAKLLSPKGPAEPTVFLGREEELSEIRKRLDKGGKLLLINAEGGIGKTTLAAKYWHESLHTYKHNAWLFCEGGITQALKELAPQLNVELSHYDTEKKQVEALRIALSKVQDDFLLVLDNANDENDIWAFKQTFEGFHWHVLFTSRCANIMTEQAYKIEHLPPPLAKSLFIKYHDNTHEPDWETKADRLLRAINYHTLLVEIFAKNLTQAKGITSIDELIKKLENEGLFMGEDSFEVESSHTDQHLKRKKATTDQILDALYDFAPLTEQPELRKTLVNFAVLPAQDYSVEFIYILFTDGEKDQKKKILNHLNALNSGGWLNNTNGQYRMNPLVQELSRKKNAVTLIDDTTDLLNKLNSILQNDGSVFKQPTQVILAIVSLIPNIGKSLEKHLSIALGSLFFKRALFARITGDAVSERESLGRYQQVIEGLLQTNATNLDLQREKGLSFNLWGDFYLRLGDARKAEENYSEALRRRRNLVSLDDGNTRWQQDLATSLSKMGDFYLRLGDARKAEENYSEDLRISRNLASLDEGNTRWQQDLATSLSKMGDFQIQQGNIEGFEKFIEAKSIHEKLLEKEPDNVQYQFDYALDFLRMGNVLKMIKNENTLSVLTTSKDLLISLCQRMPDEVNFKQHLELVQGWIEELK